MSLAMDQAEVQALFRRFAAPLTSYAASSPKRKELADMLASNLWIAMIAGPDLEDVTWKILKSIGQLDDASFQAIQRLFVDQMKPAVSFEELTELRRRFQSRKSELEVTAV